MTGKLTSTRISTLPTAQTPLRIPLRFRFKLAKIISLHRNRGFFRFGINSAFIYGVTTSQQRGRGTWIVGSLFFASILLFSVASFASQENGINWLSISIDLCAAVLLLVLIVVATAPFWGLVMIFWSWHKKSSPMGSSPGRGLPSLWLQPADGIIASSSQ